MYSGETGGLSWKSRENQEKTSMGYWTNISYFSINMKEKGRTERVMKQNKVFFQVYLLT